MPFHAKRAKITMANAIVASTIIAKIIRAKIEMANAIVPSAVIAKIIRARTNNNNSQRTVRA